MTEDVLSYGDERPPRKRPRPFVFVAIAAALAVGGVAVAHARTSTHPRATEPSASPSAPPPEAPDEPLPDPFADAVVVAVPRRDVTGVVLRRGVPGFLVWRADRAHTAFEAVVGDAWAQLLVGWCAPLGRFQDDTGWFAYDASGFPLRGDTGLTVHGVRLRDDTHVQIAADGGIEPVVGTPGVAPARRCPAPIQYPALPPRTTDVQATRGALRVIHGRYVVTTETAAFCAAMQPTGCADQGWERYAPGSAQTLPPEDLAGSYTWEGDFLVQANSSDGSLTVVRLPGARLTRPGRVGVAVRVGIPHGTFRRNGVLHLHLNPVQETMESGDVTVDDSPHDSVAPERPGDPVFEYDDVRGGVRDYVVRADADIILGRGVTGLGHPRATPDTLRRFVDQHPDVPLWLILDARGRVLRVVAEPEAEASPAISDFMPPPY